MTFMPTHGARGLEVRWRGGGEFDAETERAIQEQLDEFIADQSVAPTNRERALLRDAAVCGLIINRALAYACEQGSVVTGDGRLLPVLERSMLSFMNSRRLALVAVGLRPPREKHVDDLEVHAAKLAATEEPTT